MDLEAEGLTQEVLKNRNAFEIRIRTQLVGWKFGIIFYILAIQEFLLSINNKLTR